MDQPAQSKNKKTHPPEPQQDNSATEAKSAQSLKWMKIDVPMALAIAMSSFAAIATLDFLLVTQFGVYTPHIILTDLKHFLLKLTPPILTGLVIVKDSNNN
jgi:hypothetical protein